MMKPYLVTGKDLTLDLAVIPGKGTTGKKKALLHVCGTHGVEGFVGSGIQAKILTDLIANKTEIEKEKERPTLVFIHAVNPYGFANLRRFNEENVDLNRNHLSEEEWKEVLARDPDFVGFERLRPLMDLGRAPYLVDRYTLLFKAVYLILVNGFVTLKRALVTGQYHDSTAPYFGGKETQASIKVLQKALGEALPSGLEKLLVIDVHSGLGPQGIDTWMVADGTKDTAEKIWPGGLIEDVAAGSSNAGASSGYEHMKGEISFQKMFPKLDVFEATEEFGTVQGIFVARAMILENAAYHHAKGSRIHEITKEWLRDVFYPQNLFFKRSVLARGNKAFVQAMQYLKKW